MHPYNGRTTAQIMNRRCIQGDGRRLDEFISVLKQQLKANIKMLDLLKNNFNQ